MLEVQSLSKSYNGQLAVADVSFTVAKGEVLVLLGTSGCGKTTTLKMINRLINKSSGKILFKGRDTDNVNPFQLRREMGYVIQETGLFPHYTVAKNIAVVPELLGWTKEKINQRIDELLDLTGLEQTFRERMPHELSGGQRQRVGLARALAADPPLVLLDEPFGALDPITRAEIQKEFARLEGALNKAMVMVTHDVAEAIALGTQICLMDQGEIQQIGTPKDLIFRPANDFVRQFFASKRMELEPAVITLNDLVPFMHRLQSPQGKQVSADLSITQAMEEQQNGPVYFEKNGSTYQLGEILGIYYTNRMAIIKKLYA
ncbi:MAG: ATP-binding cassette domain-containing protein [Fulvivirga sp.]|nr:ATP-binding cassette domain-containing protein [Fulvivirga sp.]